MHGGAAKLFRLTQLHTKLSAVCNRLGSALPPRTAIQRSHPLRIFFPYHSTSFQQVPSPLSIQHGFLYAGRCHGQVRPETILILANTNIGCSGTGYSKLGFAGNDSPSFVFPTAIATKGPAAGAGGSGSGRPAVANKPTFLTGGAGPTGHLSGKRGTEDLDFFIGDEALTAAAGPGMCHM